MHERTGRLRQLMAQRGVDARVVARLIGRSETTVRIWRCKHDARVIPAQTLELLELKLGAQVANG